MSGINTHDRSWLSHLYIKQMRWKGHTRKSEWHLISYFCTWMLKRIERGQVWDKYLPREHTDKVTSERCLRDCSYVTIKHGGSLSGQPQHHNVLKMGRSSSTNGFQQSTISQTVSWVLSGVKRDRLTASRQTFASSTSGVDKGAKFWHRWRLLANIFRLRKWTWNSFFVILKWGLVSITIKWWTS